MKYGMAFIIEMYDADNNEEHRILSMPGDYIRMSKWADENLQPMANETANSLRRNYATAWHAIKRRGKLAEYGMPEKLTVETVDEMADRFTIYVEDVAEGSLPLAGEPPK